MQATLSSSQTHPSSSASSRNPVRTFQASCIGEYTRGRRWTASEFDPSEDSLSMSVFEMGTGKTFFEIFLCGKLASYEHNDDNRTVPKMVNLILLIVLML